MRPTIRLDDAPGATRPRAGIGRRVTAGVVARSSLFALGLAVSTIVFTPIALASMLLPYRIRWRVVTQ